MLTEPSVGAYIYRLHLSIDHALAVSYRRDQYGNKAEYVARITLVKGIPFYGFHVGYRFFLKIYMYNPVVMTRLADLLQQGTIMKQKFQPYEAHLQYLLQFMIDYNLYGCDYLDASKASFRSPVPEHDKGSNSSHLWHSLSIPPELITDDESLPRASHCSIEVDLCVQDIMNRRVIKERQLHHNFVERLSPISSDVKLVHSMAGLWKDETKRRKRRMPRWQQGSSPFPPEVLVSMSADPRNSQPQGWIHEDEYREQIRELIEEEKTPSQGSAPSFDSFVAQQSLEESVNTVLQSVEDLHPSTLNPLLGLSSDTNEPSPDNNEKKGPATYLDDDFFPSDSDEEGLRDLDSILQSNGRGIESEPLPNFLGICRSGMKTGKFPVMEIFPGLLDSVDEKGLVSRTPNAHLMNSSSHTVLKRVAPLPSSRLPSSKRPRTGYAPTPKTGVAVSQASDKTSEKQSLDQPPKGLLPFPSTQENFGPPTSNQLHGQNKTLNFPIVKDQNDPNTKLRLSQRSQLSSSQQSEDTGFQKHVSFEHHMISSGQSSVMTPIASSFPSQSQLELSSLSQDSKLEEAFANYSSEPTLILAALPPAVDDVTNLAEHGLPNVLYQDAFYSKEKDVPTRAREYAGREFRIQGNTLPFLPAFDPTGTSPAVHGFKSNAFPDKVAARAEYRRQSRICSLRNWEIAQPPPTRKEVEDWWAAKTMKEKKKDDAQPQVPSTAPRRFLSQIDGPTPKNKNGFKYSQKPKSTSVEHEAQYMSTMSIEIHVNTRGKFFPNPEEDEVQCIFWALKSDETVLSSQDPSESIQSGIIILSADGSMAQRIRSATNADVLEETSELDLMVRLVEVVRTYDPDILTGYEVHGSSWGYLIERARLKYDYNLCDEFSRMKTQSHGRFGKDSDRWGFNTTSTIRVTGRHMINIWRAMRGELNLLQYTMENVVWHLLHRRIPHYAWKTLTAWYKSGKPRDLSNLLKYYRHRARLDIEILEANELIPRTSEQARLLGVDFFSVFSRGSQFKVESIMFRIAKPENFMLVSPSRKQVGGQNALECLPLVMEPQSAFYNSPLLVLDFQSLYPSVMIAYNYCYSTFLGRITNWRGMNKMGFTEYKRQQGLLALLQDYINIAPNGMMYVKSEIRKSLLAKMLTEILETRVMVKSGMKQDKDDKTLQQLLNNRQLALKLLANVTYGYTSASFSGRMPCSEIADSIVQTARETLERAIAYIHSVERWGAEVVYGDTDSLFIYLKGRTKDEAFDIGNEIVKAITDMNPRPVKLKFEKVYHPCVLLAKKRYVGYMYESKNQEKPVFDAKGIETVRRDGTPAEQKIEEKALRLLFETADLSQIKAYFQSQCGKIMRGTVSVQDFCFAKEVRLGTYSEKGTAPAGALISTKRMLEDARAEPQYGERVPYVVVTGAPGARLIDRCVAPEELLANPHWRLDAEYYISKNLIPPLERIFNLVGANVRQWYDEMPKVQRIYHAATSLSTKKRTLEAYMKSTHCVICNGKFKQQGSNVLCRRCRANTPKSLASLQKRNAEEERKYREVEALCQSCSGLSPLDEVLCDSKDCPVFWTRVKQSNKMRGEKNKNEPAIRSLLEGVKRRDLQW
jgi:DNA polymerase zeta